MISTRHIARLGKLAPSVRVLPRSRTLATVTDDPLAQKVEMTNWEKGHYINYKYVPASSCRRTRLVFRMADNVWMPARAAQNDQY